MKKNKDFLPLKIGRSYRCKNGAKADFFNYEPAGVYRDLILYRMSDMEVTNGLYVFIKDGFCPSYDSSHSFVGEWYDSEG